MLYEGMRINESEIRLSLLNSRVMPLEMRMFKLLMRINILEMRTMVCKSIALIK